MFLAFGEGFAFRLSGTAAFTLRVTLVTSTSNAPTDHQHVSPLFSTLIKFFRVHRVHQRPRQREYRGILHQHHVEPCSIAGLVQSRKALAKLLRQTH